MINLGFKALWQLLFVPNVLDKRVYQESSSSMSHDRVKVLIFLAKIWTQRSVLGWEHAKHAQRCTHMLLSPVFGCEVAFLYPVTWSRGKMIRILTGNDGFLIAALCQTERAAALYWCCLFPALRREVVIGHECRRCETNQISGVQISRRHYPGLFGVFTSPFWSQWATQFMNGRL